MLELAVHPQVTVATSQVDSGRTPRASHRLRRACAPLASPAHSAARDPRSACLRPRPASGQPPPPRLHQLADAAAACARACPLAPSYYHPSPRHPSPPPPLPPPQLAILISSSAATVSFAAQGRIPAAYGVALAAVGFAATLAGGRPAPAAAGPPRGPLRRGPSERPRLALVGPAAVTLCRASHTTCLYNIYNTCTTLATRAAARRPDCDRLGGQAPGQVQPAGRDPGSHVHRRHGGGRVRGGSVHSGRRAAARAREGRGRDLRGVGSWIGGGLDACAGPHGWRGRARRSPPAICRNPSTCIIPVTL